MRQITEQEALAKLAALCSTAERCSSDMRCRLRRLGLDEEAQQRVMRRLVEGRYVDDERFCRAFVHDKVVYDRWGRRKIEQSLVAKGIEPDICRTVLDAVDDGLYVAALRTLLDGKRRSVRAASDYELTGKLVRYALQRGYTMDIIRQCVDSDAADDA